MGNNESSIELDTNSDIYGGDKNAYYLDRYNLIPSYQNNTYEMVDSNFFYTKSLKEVPDYIDLRKTFPSIIDVRTLPFNSIACVSYLLEYSLLKNELNVFYFSLEST